MILICYDGSADSQAAVDHVGELISGGPAIVLCVWEPFLDLLTRSSFGAPMFAPDAADIDSIDAGNEREARRRAEEGVERAGRAGFEAQARTRAREGTAAEAILAEADAVGARAIVIGTRGLTGVRHMLLGSVSHGVLQDADVPVIVVPSAQAAAERAARRREAEDARP
jgi:nucleotide-binding universal stress UspA family protein